MLFVIFSLLLNAFSFAGSEITYPLLNDQTKNHILLGKPYRVKISSLIPTQSSVGLVEVEARADKISKMDDKELKTYLKKKMGSVVMGPKGSIWLVDGHHLSRAMMENHHSEIYVEVLANYWVSQMNLKQHYEALIQKNWIWLYNEKGQQISPYDIPKKLEDLVDFPLRGWVWKLEKDGSLFFDEKIRQPFDEFRVALEFLKALKGKRPNEYLLVKLLQSEEFRKKLPKSVSIPK